MRFIYLFLFFSHVFIYFFVFNGRHITRVIRVILYVRLGPRVQYADKSFKILYEREGRSNRIVIERDYHETLLFRDMRGT